MFQKFQEVDSVIRRKCGTSFFCLEKARIQTDSDTVDLIQYILPLSYDISVLSHYSQIILSNQGMSQILGVSMKSKGSLEKFSKVIGGRLWDQTEMWDFIFFVWRRRGYDLCVVRSRLIHRLRIFWTVNFSRSCGVCERSGKIDGPKNPEAVQS